jgi:predicted nucleotidyltransferase
VIHRIGNLISVYLTGDFARGKDSPVIDLILVGEDIDREYLARKVMQAEELVGRKVSYVVLHPDEAECHLLKLKKTDLLPLWNNLESSVTVHTSESSRI